MILWLVCTKSLISFLKEIFHYNAANYPGNNTIFQTRY